MQPDPRQPVLGDQPVELPRHERRIQRPTVRLGEHQPGVDAVTAEFVASPLLIVVMGAEQPSRFRVPQPCGAHRMLSRRTAGWLAAPLTAEPPWSPASA